MTAATPTRSVFADYAIETAKRAAERPVETALLKMLEDAGAMETFTITASVDMHLNEVVIVETPALADLARTEPHHRHHIIEGLVKGLEDMLLPTGKRVYRSS